MVSMLVSSEVECGFVLRSGQTNYYEIGICRFSSKHAALRRKSKEWLVCMSIRRLVCQCESTVKIQLNVLV